MYEKAIVTFLDILGFKEKVKNVAQNEIKTILTKLEKETVPNGEIDTFYKAETIIFSDSIVRVRKIESPKNKEYPIGLLFNELIELLHGQSMLIQNNILIRGGITFGEIFLENNQIFGPALIKAYEFESKYAKYPRIVIDPDLIKEFKNNKLLRKTGHTLKDEIEYIADLTCKSDDGLLFVDYARAIERELDEPEMYPVFLECHKKVITENSKIFAQYDKHMEKYVWMATYHNKIINSLPDKFFKHYHVKRRNLLITSFELPSLEDVIHP